MLILNSSFLWLAKRVETAAHLNKSINDWKSRRCRVVFDTVGRWLYGWLLISVSICQHCNQFPRQIMASRVYLQRPFVTTFSTTEETIARLFIYDSSFPVILFHRFHVEWQPHRVAKNNQLTTVEKRAKYERKPKVLTLQCLYQNFILWRDWNLSLPFRSPVLGRVSCKTNLKSIDSSVSRL